MKTVEELLKEANTRLKAGNVGISICRRGGKLSLRGNFPPKPNSGKKEWSQQRLALNIYANPSGIKRAEAEAKRISSDLALKDFSWDTYIPKKTESTTIRGLIEVLEKEYFAIRERNPKTEQTWNGEYLQTFKRFPNWDKELMQEDLLSVILQTKPNTRSRQRVAMVCELMASTAEIDFDAKRYKGRYSISQVEHRDLPSDEEIVRRYYSIPNKSWRWVYGMMACYGLRNHEIFYINLDSLAKAPGILEIEDGGKTGARSVFPCYPEWWLEWELWDIKLPSVSGKNNRELGHSVTKAFGRYKVNPAYNLRHAWAVRSMLFGMDVAMASAQMGHSVDLHCSLYHKWISRDQQMKAFQILMERSNRPTAPKLE